MTLHDKLLHAVTEYDRRQAGKPGYNIWALPMMVKRVQEVTADVDRGAPVRAAILAGFLGRCLDRCLKVAGEPKATQAEILAHNMYGYTPVSQCVPKLPCTGCGATFGHLEGCTRALGSWK